MMILGSGYAYQMSPKIPYTYKVPGQDVYINFTLGNYIKIALNDKVYEGELTDDYLEQSLIKLWEYAEAYGMGACDHDSSGNVVGFTELPEVDVSWEQILEDLPSLTNDLSVILAAYYKKNDSKIPSGLDFLFASSGSDIPLRRDYGSKDEDASAFHTLRREVIIKLVQDTLKQEINSHKTYAKLMGLNYDFYLPEIANDDWTNSINDISLMSFIQGVQIGTNSYYNNYALGGSRIIETEYLYGTKDKLYHFKSCSGVQGYLNGAEETDVENVFVNKAQAAENGYWPCPICNP